MDQYTRNWILVGIVSGFISISIYFSAAFGFIPGGFRVIYPVFWLFGPFMVVYGMGQYYFWKKRLGKSVFLDIARQFWVFAGLSVTLLGTMQGVAREQFDLTTSMKFPEGTSEAIRMGFLGANSIQEGTDLTWDIFIFGGMLAYGILMLRWKSTWKILGSIGILLAVLGYMFNFWTWPANPGTAGLIDVGPFAGIFMIVVNFFMLAEFRKDLRSD